MSDPRRPRRAHRAPIQPDRVRRIERGFGFVPNRFLHGGFFAALGHTQRSLYFFLVLAGDRNGVSFYSYDRICATLQLTLDDYVEARNALIDQDLVAFDGSCFQVLSLPPRPVLRPGRPLVSADDLERDDPATVRLLVRSALGRD
jgi:hypothetical protein